MEAILFYHEDDTLIANQRRLIDHWCAMAGMFHLIVDKTNTLRRTNGNVFGTIHEAMQAFSGHEWVFMSEKTHRTLAEYTHPKTNVIYCVGSDTDGYQDLDVSQQIHFRLHTPHKQENEWYAADIVPMMIADRMMRL